MQLEVVANSLLSHDGSCYAVWFYMFAISHVSGSSRQHRDRTPDVDTVVANSRLSHDGSCYAVCFTCLQFLTFHEVVDNTGTGHLMLILALHVQ